MTCCGQKRAQLRQPRTVAVPSGPAEPAVQALTPIVFKGSGAYLVAGPHSRLVYRFSESQPEQWVDAEDAAALLRSGLFVAKR